MAYKQCYAFKHYNDEVRKRSTSGGAFSALAENVIERNGIVFGASLDTSMAVSHIGINNFEHIALLQGSKYLQSDMGASLSQVKQELLNERFILFSGTPCQVAGLKNYLGKKAETDLLITCDIICHGVSSPLIWKEYVSYKERILGGKISKANFRDKVGYQWSDCKETITVDGVRYDSDDYANIFYNHEAMRPSCYCCKYTNLGRPADLTLGDFWGVQYSHPDIYDENGISFIMVNSGKGEKILKEISSKGLIKLAKVEETKQPQLHKPVKKPITRRLFWLLYDKKGIEEIIIQNKLKYSKLNILRMLAHKSKVIIKKVLGRT